MNFGTETAVDLDKKLALGRPLNIKLGFDPTSPDLHLGHYVVLRGAKKFQELGHNVHIIVGDFTAAIGDPSGRNKLRPALSETEIDSHAKTYMSQVFMVLDEARTTVSKNSYWLGKMSITDMLKTLSEVTLSQMLVRDDFRKRFDEKTPIFMHEMTYPLMQGLDSLAIKADVELGGTDQTFNLMMGRNLQKSKGMAEQAVLTFPLLVGLDGTQKMSKSLGNHIGLMDTPSNKFGKIMSISDDTMWTYWSTLIGKSSFEISLIKNQHVNPRDAKISLASSVVELFHGIEMANKERLAFTERFSKRIITDIPCTTMSIQDDDISLGNLIKNLDMATSVSEANRKICQNAVKIDHVLVNNKAVRIKKDTEIVLQVGKLNICKVKIT